MTERFELIEKIGQGGMGTVWRARDQQTGDLVALKILHEHLAQDAHFVERFEREVEVTRRVQSDHVVRTLGFGRRDGRPFLVMELVEGRSFRDMLVEHGPFDWADVRPLLRGATLGLGAAHRVGVVHRDIKPSNVLVNDDGVVKLVDFGIARAADLTVLTGSNTSMGTPAYMPPEGVGSPQGDLYGLGCVAFEMLTGRQVFPAATPQESLLQHIRAEPDLGAIPAEARAVVGWLLRKRPLDRPKSAQDLLAVLDGRESPPRVRRAFPFNRRLIALSVGGMSLVVAGAAIPLAGLGDGGNDDGELVLVSEASPSPGFTGTSVSSTRTSEGKVSTTATSGTGTPEPRVTDAPSPTATLTPLPSTTARSGITPAAKDTPTPTPTTTSTALPTPTPASTSTATPTSTPTPTSTTPATPTATPTPYIAPGGVWVSAPLSSAIVTGDTLYLAARAYPNKVTNPPVREVRFTAWWPGLPSGPWHVACAPTAPQPGSDIYECTMDLSQVPPGQLRLSFDVWDTAGNYRLSPNGIRDVTRQ